MPGRSSDGLLDGAPPRYSARMKLSIELSAAQSEQLRREAERLGVSPEEFARAVVAVCWRRPLRISQQRQPA
jgi:hypothetical protein